MRSTDLPMLSAKAWQVLRKAEGSRKEYLEILLRNLSITQAMPIQDDLQWFITYRTPAVGLGVWQSNIPYVYHLSAKGGITKDQMAEAKASDWDMSEFTPWHDEMAANEDPINDVTSMLELRDELIKRIQGELAAASNTIIGLREKLANSEGAMKKLQQSLSQSENQNSQLVRQLRSVDEANCQLKKQLATLPSVVKIQLSPRERFKLLGSNKRMQCWLHETLETLLASMLGKK